MVDEQVLYRRLRWRLVPYLLLLYVIAWFDRVNISFAALQMNADLGFSSAVYGFGAGIFFAGYALFEVPSNLILARVGARRWISRIMITWGLISVAMMFVEGKWSFYALRFALGVAEAGFLPGILYYLSQWFPKAERARAVSWFMIGIPLATVFGGPIAGMLLGLDGWHGLQGWQWLFVLEGLPAVIFGVVTWIWLPDTPRDVRWLSAAEQKHVMRRVEEENAATLARHAGSGSLRTAMLHPTVWLLCLVLFCCQSGSYGLTLHVAIPSFIGAVGFAASAVLLSPVPGMIALTVAAMGDLCTRGPFWALPSRFLSGPALAAGIALINTMGSLGGFVGPTMVGYVREATGGFTGGLLLLAMLLVVAGVGTLVLRRSSLLREES
jgi:MFS transporter, ACS family, tartrate transporter